MKVLITGTPGTGKSTITEALGATTGWPAYDIEEQQAVVRLEDRATGQPTTWPEGFVDWNIYAWNLQERPLIDLLDSQDNAIYGVSATNQASFYRLFDFVFALAVSDASLESRLRSRTVPHHHGQGEDNIKRTVSRNQQRIAHYASEGAIIIDNEPAVPTVVKNILDIIHDRHKSTD